MSMFYELMMRKKEEIMYATIKGTLTENDGVFSGFSSSNFLELQQQLDTSKPFELVAKINVNSIGSSQTVIGTSTSTYIQLGVRGTGVLMLLLGQGGAAFNIGTLYGTTVLSTNTDYWIKGKFTGTKYELYLSTDGITWTLENSIESSTLISNSPITLQMGNGHTSNWYLRGSIDLLNSYIKLGSTKYKLQAVVGYTVVGSPTITDGVVSGMNSSNYLIVPNFPYVSADSWEIVINADTTYNSGQPQQRLLKINNYFQFQVQGVETRWQFYNGTDLYSIITSEEGLVSTYKFVKMVKSSGASSIQFYVSTDGITWITGNTIAISPSATDGIMSIGASGNGWLGTVNLNNTYIKVNNKLWFNGQQA